MFIKDWMNTLKKKDGNRIMTTIEQECNRILEQQFDLNMLRIYGEDYLKEALKLFIHRFAAIEANGAKWAKFLAEERGKTQPTIVYSGEEWSLD